ncbi:MAG: DUF4177 domain-containing protein [Acidobacteria bacterium]|nr:MAG: DUF4177 domain-containing protein [Acidobacteriota bacterium]
MRNLLSRVVLCLAAIGTLAALWVMPSYAQVPGTLPQPGMSPARFWVNNKTREESIPVNIVVADPRESPLPVAVRGAVAVSGTVAAARQPWEYRSVEITEGQDPARALNVYGNDGWEAIGVTSQQGAKATIVLKRPR